jgi:Transposase
MGILRARSNERRTDEEVKVHGGADDRGAQGARGGDASERALPAVGGGGVETLYRWKHKYGGKEVSEARRLRALEDENRRLKKLVADLALDNAALKDVLSKNW